VLGEDANVRGTQGLPAAVRVMLEALVTSAKPAFRRRCRIPGTNWYGLELAMLAHVFSNAGPALAVVVPHEMVQWVFVVTVELLVVGMLPFILGVFRRQRQRWAVTLTERS
jgi:hypothetical protein